MFLHIENKTIETEQIWFSADWHLNHENILKHCQRPFPNIEEMNAFLINSVNANIEPHHVLFYLGDFCWHHKHAECSYEDLAGQFRQQINCQNIYFIWGNHDRKLRDSKKFQSLWKGCYDLLEIKVIQKKWGFAKIKHNIVLCHYPLTSWNKCHYGAYHFYGHCHGNNKEHVDKRSLDVGVDCQSFRPTPLMNAINEIEYKIYRLQLS